MKLSVRLSLLCCLMLASCEKKSTPSKQSSEKSAAVSVDIRLLKASGGDLQLEVTHNEQKIRILDVASLSVKHSLERSFEKLDVDGVIQPSVDVAELQFAISSVRVEIHDPSGSALPYTCLMEPEMHLALNQSLRLACNKDSNWQEYAEAMTLGTTLTVHSPVDWQVFQLQADGSGRVLIRFDHPSSEARYGRARLLGPGIDAQWHTFALGKDEQVSYDIDVEHGGWMKLEILVYDKDQKIIARDIIERVGVGEVFIVAGGRNSSNCGETALSASEGVASTDGESWQKGDDPQIGTQDHYLEHCQGGSPWPEVGTTLATPDKWGVPIAFASVGHQRTTLDNWLHGLGEIDLYAELARRTAQLGKHGFRAVIWHQGEEDTPNGTTTDAYADQLRTLISKLRNDAGWQIPWIIAQASWCLDNNFYGKKWGASAAIRDAQALVWNDTLVFEGPDTDTLRGDNRATPEGNCSWSEKGAKAAALLWIPRLEDLRDDLTAE